MSGVLPSKRSNSWFHSWKRPGDVLAHHGLEQLFLAREIEEQRALGDAGAGGHFLGAGGGKAFFDEQVERGVEQLAGTRFLAPLALGLHFVVLSR